MYQDVYRGETEARLLVLGEGSLKDVSLKETGGLFCLGPERQHLANLACQAMRDRGQTVTANPIYRILSWTVGEQFILAVERGDYSQVVGTKTHPEWGIKAQVAAVCCVMECPEGFVIEQRSAQVAALPGMWHIAPSGSLQPPQGPWETLLAEAQEELGLEAFEVEDARCVGMLYGERSGVYQLSCSARTPVAFAEMMARRRSGSWEQDGFVLAPVCSQELPVWLALHRQKITPGGRAALWAEGRRRWGQAWFEQQCEDRP